MFSNQRAIDHFTSCQLLGHLLLLYETSNLTKIYFFGQVLVCCKNSKCPRSVELRELQRFRIFSFFHFLWFTLITSATIPQLSVELFVSDGLKSRLKFKLPLENPL